MRESAPLVNTAQYLMVAFGSVGHPSKQTISSFWIRALNRWLQEFSFGSADCIDSPRTGAFVAGSSARAGAAARARRGRRRSGRFILVSFRVAGCGNVHKLSLSINRQ